MPRRLARSWRSSRCVAEPPDRSHLVSTIRNQAEACARLGSPMYGQLLHKVADDVAAGGVCADVLRGHEQDSGASALALRLMGSVHRLVLGGEAPELAMYYPSAGGDWHPRAGWKAYTDLLADRRDDVRALLDQPPQTNEVGRAAALMGGLLRVGETVRLPVRLLEIGASGGLNLRADKFFYFDERGWGYGAEESWVQLSGAWRGRELLPWSEMEVVDRLGSDVEPVDVGTEQGQLTLMSYVWPDQLDRLERLQEAFRVADEVPAVVRRADAVSFVQDLQLVDGTLTVLWHSVMWQYLSRPDQSAVRARIDELGAAASRGMPFAHLSLEPARRTPDSDHEFLVALELWPGGERRILGSAHPHGVPTTWE